MSSKEGYLKRSRDQIEQKHERNTVECIEVGAGSHKAKDDALEWHRGLDEHFGRLGELAFFKKLISVERSSLFNLISWTLKNLQRGKAYECFEFKLMFFGGFECPFEVLNLKELRLDFIELIFDGELIVAFFEEDRNDAGPLV